MSAGYDLNRFITAQANVYDTVVDELREGRKRSHWMWFIFPQLAGLGRSQTAQFYAIPTLTDARAFYEHPLLGQRLVECTRLVLAVADRTAEQIFGPIDTLKFRSSMTLFKSATDNDLFPRAIDQFFNGRPDARTIAILDQRDP